jgi:hypothetical protein
MAKNEKWYEAKVSTSEAVVAVIIVFALSIISTFFIFVVTNPEALKVLIEAEATLLGFFGLIIVYMLTSIDSRIERIVGTRDDCKIRMVQADIGSRPNSVERWNKEIEQFEKRIDGNLRLKRRVVNQSTTIGLMMIISLIASVALLSFRNQFPESFNVVNSFQLLGLACGLPEMLFFESIWFTLKLFREIGATPKSLPPQSLVKTSGTS